MFAVITATLVLGVAVFIVGVATKQYELSVQARNSVYSFYAADSGIECAVNPGNWTNSGGFASTTGGTLRCGPGTATFSVPATYSVADAGGLTGTTENPTRQQRGTIYLGLSNGTVTTKGCVQVTITTGLLNSQRTTIISARGYNLCTNSGGVVAPDTSTNATVERALRLTQSGIW